MCPPFLIANYSHNCPVQMKLCQLIFKEADLFREQWRRFDDDPARWTDKQWFRMFCSVLVHNLDSPQEILLPTVAVLHRFFRDFVPSQEFKKMVAWLSKVNPKTRQLPLITTVSLEYAEMFGGWYIKTYGNQFWSELWSSNHFFLRPCFVSSRFLLLFSFLGKLPPFVVFFSALVERNGIRSEYSS